MGVTCTGVADSMMNDWSEDPSFRETGGVAARLVVTADRQAMDSACGLPPDASVLVVESFSAREVHGLAALELVPLMRVPNEEPRGTAREVDPRNRGAVEVLHPLSLPPRQAQDL